VLLSRAPPRETSYSTQSSPGLNAVGGVGGVAHTQLLLDAGASLAACGPSRVSPLHAAAAAGDPAVLALVRFLGDAKSSLGGVNISLG
jgi:hypothetical protein